MDFTSSLRITLLYSILFSSLLLLACSKPDTLFEQLPVEETGIEFNNEIFENDSVNIVNYTNMYNGGGVGIADFNNDGLQDIYFTGLMVDNQLYLNEGNFSFRNVTEQAQVGATDRWSSGVSVVDINNDGLMDIYVCATTNDNTENRTNLLYINQGLDENGVPVFTEMAKEYNVDFSGHSTMAAFFDYDNDGDLDLFLMVNQFNRHNTMNRYSGRLQNAGNLTRDYLYRNDGDNRQGQPYFVDVSDEAGITKEGYGLGVNISDINRDGWKDIVIANDFFTNDILYMNNRDGTFTDKSGQVFKHTAYAAMGNDIADLNNDGYPEVVVVDMRPEDNFRKKKMLQPNDYDTYLREKRNNYDSQFIRNVLEVYQGISPETGEPLYSDVAIYAGIAETDWSWAPLLADFDNDGLRDVIITNGFPRDMTDNDFEEYFQLYPQYVSINDVLGRLPSIKLNNYAYRNTGELKFEDVTNKWGMNIPSFSNGAAQVDLNNDGFLDLVVNNINEPAFIFKNKYAENEHDKNNYLRINLVGFENNLQGLGTYVKIEFGEGKTQVHEHTTYRGYVSSVEPMVHFGLGKARSVDRLKVVWPDSSIQLLEDIEANQIVTLSHKNARQFSGGDNDAEEQAEPLVKNHTSALNINFIHQEWDYNDYNVQPLLPHKLSQYGPGLSVGDVNSDGLSDIYISGAFDYKGTFLVQNEDNKFIEKDLIVGSKRDNREEELGSLFFDADRDGDDDLYIVSGSYEHPLGDLAYQDRIFVNENGKFLLSEEALPSFSSSGSIVRASDFDKDGDLDLFVGGRVKPHRYPEPVDSYILENISDDQQIGFEIVNDKLAPVLNEIGMITDALWTDFDNDGWTDLILTGEWMSLRFLQNDSGTFVDVTNESGLSNTIGWWNSLCGGDFDKDGDIDYLAGNLGDNTYFKASHEHPVSIYASDFDNNGVYDAIPSVYNKNERGEMEEVPFHVRRNLIEQIPSIRKKYETAHDFASVSMDELLSGFQKEDMLQYHANYMKSSYIENLGDAKFKIKPLPYQVQWAPVYGCVINDFNKDGHLDALMVGNDYGMELSTNRADALNGLALIGDGEGGFKVMNFEESGFFVPGDGKGLVSFLNAQNELLIAATQNRGALKVFKTSQKYHSLPITPQDSHAIIEFADGTKTKIEFYYGSGFLSQSERHLTIPKGSKRVTIIDSQGNARIIEKELPSL